MTTGTPTCLICGYVIYKAPHFPKWVGEFRAISQDPVHRRLFVTGVGCHDDPWGFIMSVPREPTHRWDNDYGYHNLIILAKEQPVFHDQCWALLNKRFEMGPDHIRKLCEVVSSLPNPPEGGTLSWGHDYSGLVMIDNESSYPWEDPYTDVFRHEQNPLQPHPIYSVDPINSGRILSNPPLALPNSPVVVSRPIPAHDPFSKMPIEILDDIVTLLPTSDYFSARKASKAFYTQFHTCLSWETRLKEDRPWVFEAKGARPTTDWRSLYIRTSGKFISSSLRNRKRIWNLLSTVIACCILCPTVPPLAANDHEFHVPADAEIYNRRSQYLSKFERGCQVFNDSDFYLPRYVSAVSAYIISLGDSDYICGLKMFDLYGAEEEVGYSSPKESELVKIEGHSIQGFILAVGSRGIQGMRVVGLNGNISQWLGDPSDCPKTERLHFRRHVDACRVQYDGCKLVSLAISGETPAHIESRLAASAFWYPEIPPSTMCLNDQLIPEDDYFKTRYLPFFWTHFGGPGGTSLGSVTGINCIFGHRFLERIQFTYNTPQTLGETSLGRGIITSWPTRRDFSIDGPGGERIVSIDTFYERSISLAFTDSDMDSIRSPYLAAFRVTTNWTRTCLFLDDHDTTEGLTHHTVHAPGNTVITGLYSSQKPDKNMALTMLGVMTEQVTQN